VTVNITCHVCDGRRLCEACRNAARTLSMAGFRVEHSTRYAALRAAASGTYGFDACIVPVGAHERAVVDAALSLLSGKRLAFVVDETSDAPEFDTGVAAVVSSTRYAAGEFNLKWLTESAAPVEARGQDETAAIALPNESSVDSARKSQATRRLKRVADDARMVVAKAGLTSVPRLDLLAVLEDEIAWARASGNRFGVILAHLHGVSAAKTGEPPAAGEARILDAERIIGRAVRSSDVVSGRGDDFLVVLPEADAIGLRLATQRVASAVAASGLRAAVKPRRARGFAAWSVGAACYPDDGTTRDGLIARATATLEPLAGETR
jgi:GGDEF domain-containing protein